MGYMAKTSTTKVRKSTRYKSHRLHSLTCLPQAHEATLAWPVGQSNVALFDTIKDEYFANELDVYHHPANIDTRVPRDKIPAALEDALVFVKFEIVRWEIAKKGPEPAHESYNARIIDITILTEDVIPTTPRRKPGRGRGPAPIAYSPSKRRYAQSFAWQQQVTDG